MLKYRKDSKKIKFLDFVLKQFCRVPWLKTKIKVVGERCFFAVDGFQFSFLAHQNGETELANHLKKLYKDKKFILFDVGAYHGTYTDEFLSGNTNLSAYLFEPTPNSFKTLIEKYKGLKNIVLNNFALSDFRGESQYNVHLSDHTRNGLIGPEKEIGFEETKIICKVFRGDEYCAKVGVKNINLLKIDAEAHDLNVIKGFSSLLEKGDIDVIQFEYTYRHSEVRINLGDYFKYLDGKSYSMGPLRKHGVEFYDEFKSEYNSYSNGPNFVAVRKDLAHKFLEF